MQICITQKRQAKEMHLSTKQRAWGIFMQIFLLILLTIKMLHSILKCLLVTNNGDCIINQQIRKVYYLPVFFPALIFIHHMFQFSRKSPSTIPS